MAGEAAAGSESDHVYDCLVFIGLTSGLSLEEHRVFVRMCARACRSDYWFFNRR